MGHVIGLALITCPITLRSDEYKYHENGQRDPVAKLLLLPGRLRGDPEPAAKKSPGV